MYRLMVIEQEYLQTPGIPDACHFSNQVARGTASTFRDRAHSFLDSADAAPYLEVLGGRFSLRSI
jgi:hypothetical protein